MANAIRIIMIGVMINLIGLLATAMSGDGNSVGATTTFIDQFLSKATIDVGGAASSGATELTECVTEGGTDTCTSAGAGPLDFIADAWSNGLKIVKLIAMAIKLFGLTFVPVAQVGAAVGLIGNGYFVFKVLGIALTLVYLLVNAVMWITMAKVITTRQLN